MGMYMNRFNMLKQFRKDIEDDKVFGFNYKRFALTGIIVQDVNDDALISRVSSLFFKWAEMTGDNFLFITFIQPSIAWNNEHTDDSYWIDMSRLMADSTFTKEDEERTVPLLRDFLGLPSSGSYLVLTDDLSSNNFYEVPISAETIEDQLLLVTKYCDDDASGVEHTPGDFKKLLTSLNAKEYKSVNALLDILIDFTSMISSLIDKEPHLHEEQLRHVDSVIDKLRTMMKAYNGPDYEEKVFHLFEMMEIVYTKLFRTYQSRLDPRHRPDEQSNHVSNRYLDNYSNRLYRTYSLLSSITRRTAENLDYSGLTIYLGKIVENELHLSIEQMVRYAMGIDMPTYYNKYCSLCRKLEIQVGKQFVNLNRRQFQSDNTRAEAKLQGIPMGTLLVTYETMLERPETVYPEPDTDRLQELDSETMSFLKNFSSSYRNPAGHLDSNSKQTYKGASEAFNQFLDNYLVHLYDIKQSLRE